MGALTFCGTRGLRDLKNVWVPAFAEFPIYTYTVSSKMSITINKINFKVYWPSFYFSSLKSVSWDLDLIQYVDTYMTEKYHTQLYWSFEQDTSRTNWDIVKFGISSPMFFRVFLLHVLITRFDRDCTTVSLVYVISFILLCYFLFFFFFFHWV